MIDGHLREEVSVENWLSTMWCSVQWRVPRGCEEVSTMECVIRKESLCEPESKKLSVCTKKC